MGGVGVAADFPEAGLVVGEEFDAVDPLGAFPSPELGGDHADGAAVFAGEGGVVDGVDEEDIVFEGFFEWEVGGVVVVGVAEDVGGVVGGFGEGGEGGEADADPFHVHLGPGGDAVEVGDVFDLLECVEVFPVEGDGIVDLAVDGECPGIGFDLRLEAKVEDGPFAGCGFGLPGGELGHAVAIGGTGAFWFFIGGGGGLLHLV